MSKVIDELIKRLTDDLFAIPYHSTDEDACHLHEKHTSQCYGCRHAKWSNIIKTELKDRLDTLTVKQSLATELVRMLEEALPEKREITGQPGIIAHNKVITGTRTRLTAIIERELG